MSSASGSNYSDSTIFATRSHLALHLYYDAVVTSRNALGRAAVRTRKYHVISFRIANVAATARDSDCILPLAIVPPQAWEKFGFDAVIRELKPELERLQNGM